MYYDYLLSLFKNQNDVVWKSGTDIPGIFSHSHNGKIQESQETVIVYDFHNI